MARRGDVWYAWQDRDETGWDIIRGEGGLLAARRRAVAEAYRLSAKDHSRRTGHPIRLARFELAEVLDGG